MSSLFAKAALADVHQDVMRNIISLHKSQDLFDDLSNDPAAWATAQRTEDAVKPSPYRSRSPVIDRPFEDAEWFNAIEWPFRHWQASRFSNGGYGVWYGSDSVETTVFESAYHWFRGLLHDAGFERERVFGERKVYRVLCTAALLDFRPVTAELPELLHSTDYQFAQTAGARIHREGHPGLLIQSVRRPQGENYAVFNPAVLSNPRHDCRLTYRLDGGRIVVEKRRGMAWLEIEVARFG